MVAFSTYSTTLAVAVAEGGTVSFPLVAPDNDETFNVSNPLNQAMVGQALFHAPAVQFGAGGGNVVLANADTNLTWPVGAVVGVTVYHDSNTDIIPGTGVEVLTDNSTGVASDTLVALAAVAVLVNNSGGAAGGNTVAAVTDVATAAGGIATLTIKLNALLVEYVDIKNAIASLAAKQNALIDSLTGAGFLENP